MKSVFSMLFIAAALTLSAADDNSWKLVWEENFDNPVLNP